MPVALRDLPFFDTASTVEVAGVRYQILAWQHVVWVSLGPKGLTDPGPRLPRFPAIYDTGFTDAFIIHADQLRRFAGLVPQHLTALNAVMRPPGRRVPLHAANVWPHPNRRGERDTFSGAAPFLLEIHHGIGICNDPDGFSRLPLLGPRAFLSSGLEVCIEHAKLPLNARTLRRFWPFG